MDISSFLVLRKISFCTKGAFIDDVLMINSTCYYSFMSL